MASRDLWHSSFATLIKQRAPPSIEVRVEVPLADEPQRADILLLRRHGTPPLNEEAQVLRGLWPHLTTDTIVEFKSPVKGFRRSDLMRLASYGAQYHVLEHERVLDPRELSLVLVVPSRNAALDDEIARMRRWAAAMVGSRVGCTLFIWRSPTRWRRPRKTTSSGFSAGAPAKRKRPRGGGDGGWRRTRPCRTRRTWKVTARCGRNS